MGATGARVLLAVAAALLLCAAAEESPAPGRFVVICPIEELVDEGLAVVVQRAVKEAQGAEAIIFSVDTLGGLVDAALAITESILEAPCRTIAFVRHGQGATSAGALISFACNEIVMEPGSTIGAVQPVTLSTEGSLPTGEKEVSFLRAKIAALAEHNGHNPDIAQAMVDKDVELYARRDENGRVVVWSPTFGGVPVPESAKDRQPLLGEVLKEGIEAIEDEFGVPLGSLREAVDALGRRLESIPREGEQARPQVSELEELGPEPRLILPRGKLLTWTAAEAELYGLIPFTAMNVDEVMERFGHGGARKHFIEMTWAEKTFRWLTNPMVSGVLFMIALAGLYIEIKTPGFGLPGIISIVAFTLFFGARAVLGLAEWIDLALVLVGLALILVEFFVLPGFGLVGVAGILCLFAGLYLSFTLDSFEWPQYDWQFYRAKEAGLTLLVAMGTFLAFLVAAWKLLPLTPAYGHLILADVQQKDKGFVVQTTHDQEHAIGLKGVALTMLRPAGKGRFGDQTYQVVTRAEFLEPGTPIVIVQAEGNRYVVEPTERRA